MVKNYYYQQGRHIPTLGLVPKVARTMKLTCLLLCLSIGFVFANQSQAQRNVLSLDLSEMFWKLWRSKPIFISFIIVN